MPRDHLEAGSEEPQAACCGRTFGWSRDQRSRPLPSPLPWPCYCRVPSTCPVCVASCEELASEETARPFIPAFCECVLSSSSHIHRTGSVFSLHNFLLLPSRSGSTRGMWLSVTFRPVNFITAGFAGTVRI